MYKQVLLSGHLFVLQQCLYCEHPASTHEKYENTLFLTELAAAADMTAETRYYICPMLISITTTHYSDQPEAIYNHLEASAHHFHN